MRRIAIAMNFSYSFSREIWRGIVRYSYEKGRWSLWPVDLHHMDNAAVRQFDGIIGFIGSKEEGERLREQVRPLVNISNRGSGYTMPSVLNDDIGIGEMAGQYFINKGFRSFAYYGGDSMTYSRHRLQGFRRTIEAAGFSVHLADIIKSHEAQREWTRSLPVATAVFCANDQTAFNFIRRCWEMDIPIPQHLAVLGVDNDETYCQSGIIGLSSILLASETLGYKAAELLDRQLNGEEITQNPPPIAALNIVTRLSTDMQAVNDELVRKALRFIQNNVHSNFQVDDLLRHLFVGRRTLERKFKEHLGHSPHFAINRARVEMAKRLLETTEFKMDDIAVRCGFSEARILYRNFRMITGESPARYRKHFR